MRVQRRPYAESSLRIVHFAFKNSDRPEAGHYKRNRVKGPPLPKILYYSLIKTLNPCGPLTRFAGALPKGEPRSQRESRAPKGRDLKCLPLWGRWHAVGVAERANVIQYFYEGLVLNINVGETLRLPHSALRALHSTFNFAFCI